MKCGDSIDREVEATCLLKLASLRWPRGPVCDSCHGMGRVNFVKARLVFWCGRCERHFTPRAGTIFARSHVPLSKWFTAIGLATRAGGVAPAELGRLIGVTPRTASRMLRLMRSAAGGPAQCSEEIGT